MSSKIATISCFAGSLTKCHFTKQRCFDCFHAIARIVWCFCAILGPFAQHFKFSHQMDAGIHQTAKKTSHVVTQQTLPRRPYLSSG